LLRQRGIFPAKGCVLLAQGIDITPQRAD